MSRERVLVTNYRGFDIYIETDEGTFHVTGDDWQDAKDRKSLKACYTFIDQYLKDNQTFTPIEAMTLDAYGRGEFGEVVRFTGMRKDGRLVFEDGEQLSSHEERHYLILAAGQTAEARRIIGEMEALSAKMDALNAERGAWNKQLEALGTNLKDHLKKLRGERQ